MVLARPDRPLRVLVVDDNKDAADSLGLLLSLWGHEPAIAYHGAAAWALAVSRRPDVALLDLAMPGLTGVDLARRFRADPVLKSSLLVAVTGCSQPREREQSVAAGIHFYLVKPVRPEHLQALLATAGHEGLSPRPEALALAVAAPA